MWKLDSTILTVAPGGNAGDGGGGNRSDNMLQMDESAQLITHKNPRILMQRIVADAKIKPCS